MAIIPGLSCAQKTTVWEPILGTGIKSRGQRGAEVEHWGRAQGCSGNAALSHQHCHPAEGHSWAWAGLRWPRVHPTANTHLPQPGLPLRGCKELDAGATSPGQSPASSQQPKDSSKHKRNWGSCLLFPGISGSISCVALPSPLCLQF